jgi:branched-chain amino acid transport system ATP-binding protein
LEQKANNTILQVENINTSYGEVQILNDVSLKVHEEELVLLLGGNGAGKSTLLKSISGLLNPGSGRILFKGEEITGKKPEEIARLGIAHCPEGRMLFPEMSVLDNLKAGAYRLNDKTEIKRNLDLVYHYFPILNERQHEKAGKFSGGQQQMLAIGRALMLSPQILMLDEPSLGLAPLLVDTIVEIIERLGKEFTILLVEQNAKITLDIADRGYVLMTGRIYIKGTIDELKKHDYIKKAYMGIGDV